MDRNILYAIIVIGNIFVIIINIANIRLMRKIVRFNQGQVGRLHTLYKLNNPDIKTQGVGKSWLLPTEDCGARPIPFESDRWG